MVRTRPHSLSLMRRARKRLAVGTLFIALVGIPVVGFVGVLSADLTTTISAHRQASNIAEEASLAGAAQFQPNSASLDDTKAHDTAQAFITEAFSGADHIAPAYLQYVNSTITVQNSQTVVVTIQYHVNGRIILPLFESFKNTKDNGSIVDTNTTVSRTASVCVPASATQPGGTQGFCQRPSY